MLNSNENITFEDLYMSVNTIIYEMYFGIIIPYCDKTQILGGISYGVFVDWILSNFIISNEIVKITLDSITTEPEIHDQNQFESVSL